MQNEENRQWKPSNNTLIIYEIVQYIIVYISMLTTEMILTICNRFYRIFFITVLTNSNL